RGAATFLNVVSVLLTGFALISIARSHWAIAKELASAQDKLGKLSADKDRYARPDIFYIILDGYGRTDTFEKEYGFSDQDFIQALEGKGFYVAKHARTNYVQTELSLASSLNLNYLDKFMKRTGNPSEERGILDQKIDESEVSKFLKGLGYRYFAITTGFPALRFKSADVAIEQESGGSLFINALRDLTPFPTAETGYQSQYTVRRKHIEGGFHALESLASPGAAPKFVVLHVLAPHPPFVFGPNGESRLPKGPFGFWDGSHFHDLSAGRNDYVSGYRDQAKYIAKRTLQALERVFGKATSPPVVIIQGDHGPKNELNQDSLEKSNLDEVFGILNALYVPDSVRRQLDRNLTPVNTFRTLFTAMFGANLPRLPDRSYFSPWGAPLDFVDVTDRLSTSPEETEPNPAVREFPTNSAGTSP
ncbi:MAG TPA: hypothetical protein PLX06_10825, partial [Fimbriimonadaceae bacterium]|nr:hypothetical protein [Fimbriimonadaceae bacterium]